MNSSTNHYLTAVYFVSAILLGNTTLLSLFLAIVLDSFSSEDEEGHDTKEKRLAKLQKAKEELKQK
jgi:glutamine synthetase